MNIIMIMLRSCRYYNSKEMQTLSFYLHVVLVRAEMDLPSAPTAVIYM